MVFSGVVEVYGAGKVIDTSDPNPGNCPEMVRDLFDPTDDPVNTLRSAARFIPEETSW
jgi:hypothetical protein